MTRDAAVDLQLRAALRIVRRVIGPALAAVYLYGSAVENGLRPDSDLDLFVVTDRWLTADEKARVVAGLLPLSGRETRRDGWRPLEVTIVALPEVRPWRYPLRMELQYGEWLREQFLAGRVEPEPPENADLAVLVAMVRGRGEALFGPAPDALLEAVPRADLARAMVDTVPSLMNDLRDDTRNVLLTLARIWTTLATGEIRSKDAAAEWAIANLPDDFRPLLLRARDLYRDGGFGDWPELAAVRSLAGRMVAEIGQVAEA